MRILLAVLALFLIACGQPRIPGTILSEPRTIAGLPPHIVPTEGELTLVADFGDVREQRISLYLINATDDAVVIPAQDGDPYIKLEAQTDTEGWSRAQSHVFSDCGLSYDHVELPAGEFMLARGYHPAGGEPATVRYRVYGTLELVSNAGPGFVVSDEQWRAHHDIMAIRRGQVSLLRKVLFEDLGLSGGELEEARREAIKRLGELPSKEAVPVLDDLLAADLAVDELEATLESYHAVAPRRLAAYVRRVVAKDDPRRVVLLSALEFMARIEDDALLRTLNTQVVDPTSSGIASMLDYISGYRTPEVEQALLAVEASAAHAEVDRIRARWLREQWYGDDGINLRIDTPGNHSDGHPAPVLMTVTILNESERRVYFDYRHPTEILVMYLTLEKGRDRGFVPPRAGVKWLAPASGGRPVHVDLDPGETHQLVIGVMDYFDIPKKDDGSYETPSVWMSIAIPGFHRTPSLAGGGAGINPR